MLFYQGEGPSLVPRLGRGERGRFSSTNTRGRGEIRLVFLMGGGRFLYRGGRREKRVSRCGPQEMPGREKEEKDIVILGGGDWRKQNTKKERGSAVENLPLKHRMKNAYSHPRKTGVVWFARRKTVQLQEEDTKGDG